MRQSYGEYILEQERREKAKKAKIIAAVAVLAVSAVIALVLWLRYDASLSTGGTIDSDSHSQEVYYTEAELQEQVEAAKKQGLEEVLTSVRQQLLEGKSVVEVFRDFYTDELVVASNGSYHFIPIQENLKKNDYVEENLNILETGEIQYVENGQVTSYKGIDVSKFQGRIDWQQVAADGVQFAFIRVGNRGYENGRMVEDERFDRNIRDAIEAGIKVGVYFYTQAVNEAEVLEEAQFVLNKIAPYQVECPVVFDVEKVSGQEARMNGLTAEERTHLTKVFCDTIANAGYKPMIYFNLEVGATMLNLADLETYDKWFAYYNPDFYFPYDYKIWQYSENGTVAGINGPVDMNISFEPLW